MSPRRWVTCGVAAGAVILGACWVTAAALPVPWSLVGEWENESPILSAGPGEVRLTIRPDGIADVAFDRARYVWPGSDRFACRVRGGEAVIRTELGGDPVTLRIEFGSGWFRVWDPASPDPDRDAIVFRRPTRRE